MTRKAMKGNSSHANGARIERGVLDFIHTTFPILVTSSCPWKRSVLQIWFSPVLDICQCWCLPIFFMTP